ncbi:MAG: FMN-binding protein [Chloroflexi bacterium]|nr:FMN-binding protein [Chloroflexota bacterium]
MAASAITAVYAVGYIHTQTADASLGAPDTVAPTVATSPAAIQPPAVTTTNPSPPSTTRQGSTSATSATGTSSATQPSATLKDGTYNGVGTSRRGNVQVSLSVQSGRIASVNITGASTEYPTRDIASLPGQVVSRQSSQIDIVSGATYSSLAFRGAVQQALQKAQA